jgi:hypothetical protein
MTLFVFKYSCTFDAVVSMDTFLGSMPEFLPTAALICSLAPASPNSDVISPFVTESNTTYGEMVTTVRVVVEAVYDCKHLLIIALLCAEELLQVTVRAEYNSQ